MHNCSYMTPEFSDRWNYWSLKKEILPTNFCIKIYIYLYYNQHIFMNISYCNVAPLLLTFAYLTLQSLSLVVTLSSISYGFPHCIRLCIVYRQAYLFVYVNFCQVAAFRSLEDSSGRPISFNFRDIQDINLRTVREFSPILLVQTRYSCFLLPEIRS